MATSSANGLMASADKSKLDGIAAGANNYSHPTNDGNKHVPATGTSNAGKVLTAGSTAGALSWTALPTKLPANGGDSDTVSGFTVGINVPANAKFTDTVYTHPTTAGNKHIPAGGSAGQILRWSEAGTAVWGADNNTTYGVVTGSANGLMIAADKTKLDGIATGANKTILNNTVTSTSTTEAATANAVKTAYDKANHAHPYNSINTGSSQPTTDYWFKVIG